jgi:hypothetical protein
MNLFSESLKYGKTKEIEVLPLIKDHFNSDYIKIPKNKYSTYDFIDDTNEIVYELKSRTNKYNQYSTTMIQEDKILNTHYKQIFLFNYIDGLYYIEYDKTLFNEFDKKKYSQYRTDKVDVFKNYIYIPIDKLKQIILY